MANSMVLSCAASPAILVSSSPSSFQPKHMVSSVPISPTLSASQAIPLLARPFPARPQLARAMADGTRTQPVVEEKQGVRIERNPPESRLSELSVRSWPKWGCPPSKFPWTYSGTETCYLLKGKVKVYVEGSSDCVEIGAGDLVVFPNGMNCTWDVSEAVDKHYSFD